MTEPEPEPGINVAQLAAVISQYVAGLPVVVNVQGWHMPVRTVGYDLERNALVLGLEPQDEH